MSGLHYKFKIPSKLQRNHTDVWVEYAELAENYKPLDLGSEHPDYQPPNCVVETFVQVANSDNSHLHQYTRDYGHPRLVSVLAQLYSPLFQRKIDPQNEILITVGAQGGIFCSILGHVDQGDEVIIIEPHFHCYEPLVKMAGGIPRFIPLRQNRNFAGEVPTSGDWCLNREELQNLFNSKTKAIILNNPHSPVGKVFKEEELEHIAELCKKWNVLCISDEVYEWIVYEPNKHIRIATLPGMWERTITIGSAGKTFGMTGWKLGWAIGPANLLYNLLMVHQNSFYTGSTPLQEVIAMRFEKELLRLDHPDCYFNSISTQLVAKRDFLAKLLIDIGMEPSIPEGGYFMMADWSPLESHVDLSSESDIYKDYRFTKWMTKNVGVQGIPPTVFYSDNKNLAENFVRYCFFKKNEILEEAEKILKQWKCGKINVIKD